MPGPCCLQNHQADQLKQEISSKDSALMKVKYDHIKASGCPPWQLVVSCWHRLIAS